MLPLCEWNRGFHEFAIHAGVRCCNPIHQHTSSSFYYTHRALMGLWNLNVSIKGPAHNERRGRRKKSKALRAVRSDGRGDNTARLRNSFGLQRGDNVNECERVRNVTGQLARTLSPFSSHLEQLASMQRPEIVLGFEIGVSRQG